MEHKEHEHHEHKSKLFTSKQLNSLIFIFVIILLVFILFNVIQTSMMGSKLNKVIADVKEQNRPADIELTSIIDSKCVDCFDISPTIESVKSNNVKILNEKEIDFGSDEAKQLINKYKIEKIPTIIITGEIDKTDLSLDKEQDILLLKNINPPYTDAKTGIIKGQVRLIHLKANCEDCTDLNDIIQGLKDSISIVNERIHTFGSKEQNELIKKYNIEKLPSLILSEELEVYSEISNQWSVLGTKESDGSYVLRELSLPYYDFKKKKIEGLVKVIYLSDKECNECYDVENHKAILDRFGIKFSSEKEIDISDNEADFLIKEYQIVLVPTLILSKDVGVYTSFNGIWDQVGTIEEDGTYVFRSVEVMGTHKNLETNKIIDSRSS